MPKAGNEQARIKAEQVEAQRAATETSPATDPAAALEAEAEAVDVEVGYSLICRHALRISFLQGK